ncbi:MAG: 1-(5-phosphoribosyl)-5-[(5-phosphoribosylamino)methylideneamino] imidazole-4-carboxamide isomerase [Pyrobaculum sp.]
MIIPSIDIEGGKAVKRVQGRRGEYVFVGNPLDLAKRFSKAPLVHVVDLDGAEAGAPVNIDVVSAVAAELGGRCQLGGGLRSVEWIRWALSRCAYAVVGSLPFKNPEVFKQTVELYRERLVASIDYRGGVVVVDGWRSGVVGVEEAVRLLKEAAPLGGVVVTSVDVEGTGTGAFVKVPVTSLREVAKIVLYAGGIRDCKHVEEVLKAGFDGVIVGYALYKGNLRGCAEWL